MKQNTAERMGLMGAIAIGIGGMVGGGIFAVLGEAVSTAHGATPVAFALAGVVALLTAVSYARLAVAYPNRGGTVVYIDNAFGNNLASGSVNVMLWLSYLVTIALYASAFASYAATFFADGVSPLQQHALISVAIILPTAINLISASFVSRSETLIVVLKLALLVFIIYSSLPYMDIQRVSPAQWGDPLSIVAAGMIIFVAYEGFELIANAAEDIENPRRNLPLAFVLSVVLVMVLYMVIAVLTVSTVSEAQLVTARDYALAVAARPALGQSGFVIVAAAALLATFSAINATIYGNARLGYTLARDGQLPEQFDHEVWNKPVVGVLMTAIISLLIANTISLNEIAIIGSASFLLIFTLVNASACRLRQHIGGSIWLYGAGTMLCALALVVLLIHTCQTDVRALWVFLGFLLISCGFEGVFGTIVRGHFLGRQY
ncbi:amino acid transporter [Pokkaliibacter plantistimulans]|uniref:Amino acid transporter n=1 Tax=Pokkaliibacter plantistimulans TaxID=1635171 RepID=A0ABX5M0Q5_9GAMM|nr:APC family permease [Pokkaliibacter plantistimulans]PXF32072.1 amino acid transporter [Pokkaliibacter plantistimulans]